MAPQSPTRAFDPTPALEHDTNNYSPLNDFASPTTSSDPSNNIFKGVRFSDPPSMPPVARHSIATANVPLLPSVPSASRLPKHGFQVTNTSTEIDMTKYMEQCRLWNTRLRESHESERKAWDIERTALRARIAELEQKLNKSRDRKRRSSNDSYGIAHIPQPDFQPFAMNGQIHSHHSPENTTTEPPVWIGPEYTPPATRVFFHEGDVNHLPSISENEALPALTQEISPTSGVQQPESVPVPVEQIDPLLDGVTLKSTALTSTFDKDIVSPQFASPERSPSSQPKRPSDTVANLDVKSLLSPLDDRLKKHAGHTPMAFDGTLSSGTDSTAALTPRQEQPFAPAPTKRPPLRPTENSDSYFSFTSAAASFEEADKENHKEGAEHEQQPVHDPEDDPSLKGPLILDPKAQSAESTSFLSQVDAKLTEEVSHREQTHSTPSGDNEDTEKLDKPTQEDDMPRLKIRKSSNFGSAWGGGMPGRI